LLLVLLGRRDDKITHARLCEHLDAQLLDLVQHHAPALAVELPREHPLVALDDEGLLDALEVQQRLGGLQSDCRWM